MNNVGKSKLDLEFKNLKVKLLDLLKQVQEEHQTVFSAMETKNFAILAQIKVKDKEIAKAASELTGKVIWKIAQRQLFASDLRTATGYMYIIRDLERISNYAKNISKFNDKYKPDVILVKYLKSLMAKTFKMMDLIIEAIAKNNFKKAKEAAIIDEEIDTSFRIAMKEIIDIFLNTNQNGDQFSQYTSAIQQLKYIERLGDHLVNICETISYIISGKFTDLTKPLVIT